MIFRYDDDDDGQSSRRDDVVVILILSVLNQLSIRDGLLQFCRPNSFSERHISYITSQESTFRSLGLCVHRVTDLCTLHPDEVHTVYLGIIRLLGVFGVVWGGRVAQSLSG